MLVTRKINNNVAVCLDGKGRELIAFGKGIGYPETPYELQDLSKVDRTFYNVSRDYWALMNTISPDIIEFTAQIIDSISHRIPYDLSPNIVFMLSDHISFAIQRAKKGIWMQFPSIYQLEQDYPLEIRIGKYFVSGVNRRFKVELPKGEISAIAMQFINARKYPAGNRARAAAEDEVLSRYDEILEQTIQIVEREMKITVQKGTYNYRRFATHLEYLLKRMLKNQYVDSDNEHMYQMFREEYEDIALCVDKIANYYMSSLSVELTDEEKLYLMLHTNRICAKSSDEASVKNGKGL